MGFEEAGIFCVYFFEGGAEEGLVVVGGWGLDWFVWIVGVLLRAMFTHP